VAIARALANDPKVILADEPTGNLDQKTGGQILKLLRNLVDTEQRTIILISHDSEVAGATDFTAELADGTLRRIVRREH
jgi:putative ABC transport system ATP-binding protein